MQQRAGAPDIIEDIEDDERSADVPRRQRSRGGGGGAVAVLLLFRGSARTGVRIGNARVRVVARDSASARAGFGQCRVLVSKGGQASHLFTHGARGGRNSETPAGR